jgi:hypothetical protein
MEKAFPGGGHSTFYDYSQQSDLTDLYKWCFIRNPYDRVASFFFNIKVLVGSEGKIKEKYSDNLESFILDLDQWVVENPDNKIKYDFQKYPVHLFPLDFFITCENYTMDFIGRFENIENDWNFISEKFNVIKNLGHTNQSKSLDSYLPLYTSEMKSVINRIYESDFKYYPKIN